MADLSLHIQTANAVFPRYFCIFTLCFSSVSLIAIIVHSGSSNSSLPRLLFLVKIGIDHSDGLFLFFFFFFTPFNNNLLHVFFVVFYAPVNALDFFFPFWCLDRVPASIDLSSLRYTIEFWLCFTRFFRSYFSVERFFFSNHLL